MMHCVSLSACELKTTPLPPPKHQKPAAVIVFLPHAMADAPGVELLRKSWEMEDHWVLRRDFMIRHRDRIPEPDRLLCMAQLFVNIETLGVKYDEDLMAEIEQLAEDVPSLIEFRRKKLVLQSEERFKAPPKASRARNELGSRNMTHDRYQSHQQNYAQSRQNQGQYQQMHGYGKAYNQPYTGQTYGQGYNAQPVAQHVYGGGQRSYQPQQQHYQSQPQNQPVYGRNAGPPVSNQQYGGRGGGQRQDYGYGRSGQGRGGHQGSGSGQAPYSSLLTRGHRR